MTDENFSSKEVTTQIVYLSSFNQPFKEHIITYASIICPRKQKWRQSCL